MSSPVTTIDDEKNGELGNQAGSYEEHSEKSAAELFAIYGIDEKALVKKVSFLLYTTIDTFQLVL